MKSRTTHTKTLTTNEVARALKAHFKLPEGAAVRFVVTSEYDPSDWQGQYGPDHVCREVVVTWDE